MATRRGETRGVVRGGLGAFGGFGGLAGFGGSGGSGEADPIEAEADPIEAEDEADPIEADPIVPESGGGVPPPVVSDGRWGGGIRVGAIIDRLWVSLRSALASAPEARRSSSTISLARW